MEPRSSGLFVTGTDTDVGKTAVAAAILRQLVAEGRTVGAYKPAASGVGGRPAAAAAGPGDPETLWRAAGCPLSAAAVCPQVFRAAIAPATAARAEGKEIDESLLRTGIEPWIGRSECVVVEGAGGLFSPLSDRTLNADLAREFGYPLVIVDSGRLGAIGRVLSNARAAVAEGLPIAAVVISHVEPLEETGADDPASGWSIAESARGDLARRLSPLPVLLLRHGGDSIEPATAWTDLSRSVAGSPGMISRPSSSAGDRRPSFGR